MKILLAPYVWPESSASAAGLRTDLVLEALLEAQFSVECISFCRSNPARERLETLGIRTHIVDPNDSAQAEAVIRRVSPDVVIFDRFVMEEQWGWRVKEWAPEAIRVIDMQDFHALRKSRASAIEAGMQIGELAKWDQEALLREISSILKSDLTLVLSKFEFELLEKKMGVSRELLHYSPFGFAVPKQLSRPSDRRHIRWIGNGKHLPNVDGLKWFLTAIWPTLYPSLPQGCHLQIAGAYFSKEFKEWVEQIPRVEWMGQVESAEHFLGQAQVAIAPLRFGAGLKGKVCMSMMVGTPTVTTSIGAEGISSDPSELKISDDPDLFSALILEVVSLFNQKTEEWQSLSRSGQNCVKREFDRERVKKTLIETLKKAYAERYERRERNLIGQILWREQYRSSEFFSRWIEAKRLRAPLDTASH